MNDRKEIDEYTSANIKMCANCPLTCNDSNPRDTCAEYEGYLIGYRDGRKYGNEKIIQKLKEIIRTERKNNKIDKFVLYFIVFLDILSFILRFLNK